MKSITTKTIFVWAIFVMVSLFFTGVSYALDPGSVVGLWLFDDGGGDIAVDSSGQGNDGALMGGPTWVAGKFGGALELDGVEQYVDCGGDDSLDMGAEMTLAFWIKTGKEMVDMWADRQVVMGKHYLEYEIGIYVDGQIHTYTSDGAGNYDEGIMVSMADSTGDANWVVGKWYHVAWTLNGAHETAYVNGINIGEFDKANAGTTGGDHLLEIGRRTEGGLPFQGAIDEVMVANVALPESDIQNIMDNGLAAALGMAAAVSPVDSLTATWGSIKK